MMSIEQFIAANEWTEVFPSRPGTAILIDKNANSIEVFNRIVAMIGTGTLCIDGCCYKVTHTIGRMKHSVITRTTL